MKQLTWWYEDKGREECFFRIMQLEGIEADWEVKKQLHKMLAQGEPNFHVLSWNDGTITQKEYCVCLRINKGSTHHTSNLSEKNKRQHKAIC